MQALPVLIIGIPAPFVIGLWLFRGALREASDADPRSQAPDYHARLARWRRAGNVLLTLGIVGLIAALGAAIYVAAGTALQPPPAPSATPPDLSQMQGSIGVTAALIASPAAIVLGLLLRWKR
jgi:hypothetical protein